MNNRFSRAMHGYMCNKKCVCFFNYAFQFMLYYKSKYSKSVKFVSISWNPLIKIRLVYLSIEYCRGASLHVHFVDCIELFAGIPHTCEIPVETVKPCLLILNLAIIIKVLKSLLVSHL